MEEKDRIRLKGLVTLPGIAIGSVIAAVYLALTLLIPSQVRMIQNGLTNARMYPYFVCICSMLLAIGFMLVFRKDRFSFDLGIWPMVLASLILYFGIKTIGFYTSTVIVIIFMMLMWNNRCWWKILLTSVLTPVSIYLAFTVGMRIFMPTGILI
ncbi:MAG: tripartite tricarboxylate transporter TctB family protein [Sphaerochaetaceae bacterium]|nr:tripartite tricarboxylate transporter TctB family protein [Sphaerochaetaceae bacterium]